MSNFKSSNRDTLISIYEQFRANSGFGLPRWATDERPRPEQPVILLGHTSFTCPLIEGAPGLNILGIVDDHRVGQSFQEIPYLSSMELVTQAMRYPDLVCVNMGRWDLSRRYFRLLAKEFKFRILSFEQSIRYFKPEKLDFRFQDWGPYIADHLSDILKIGDLMVDEYSKETLYGVMLFHLTTDPEYYLHIARIYETLYFRSGFFRLSSKESFVDCGASIGESITHFLGLTGGEFEQAVLIEPDKHNIPKLELIRNRYRGTPTYERMTIFPCALGAKKARVAFLHEGGHGGRVIEGEGDTEIQALDDIIKFDPTLLKLDIEGFEAAALQGGSQMIAKCRPKITVSAYHRPSDIVEITKLLTGLNPDYRIGLRHHNMERWDTCLYFF